MELIQYTTEAPPITEKITNDIYVNIYNKKYEVLHHDIVIESVDGELKSFFDKRLSDKRFFDKRFSDKRLFVKGNTIASFVQKNDGMIYYIRRTIQYSGDDITFINPYERKLEYRYNFINTSWPWDNHRYAAMWNPGTCGTMTIILFDMMTGDETKCFDCTSYKYSTRFICYKDEKRKAYLYDTMKQKQIHLEHYTQDCSPFNTSQLHFPNLQTHCYGCFTKHNDMIELPCGCVRYCKDCMCDQFTCPSGHQCSREELALHAIKNNNIILQYMDIQYTKAMVSLAIQYGSIDVLKYMVDKGALINQHMRCIEFIIKRYVKYIVQLNNTVERYKTDTHEMFEMIKTQLNTLEEKYNDSVPNIVRYNKPININPLKIEALNTKALNTEALNTEAFNIGVLSTEALNAEALNTEVLNTEALNAEVFNTETFNKETFDKEVFDSNNKYKQINKERKIKKSICNIIYWWIVCFGIFIVIFGMLQKYVGGNIGGGLVLGNLSVVYERWR